VASGPESATDRSVTSRPTAVDPALSRCSSRNRSRSLTAGRVASRTSARTAVVVVPSSSGSTSVSMGRCAGCRFAGHHGPGQGGAPHPARTRSRRYPAGGVPGNLPARQPGSVWPGQPCRIAGTQRGARTAKSGCSRATREGSTKASTEEADLVVASRPRMSAHTYMLAGTLIRDSVSAVFP
jgi:hypothetical protein